MAWRNAATWLGFGMTMSAGLVWAGRAFKRREISPRASQFEPEPELEPVRFEPDETFDRRARLEAKLDAIVREEAARFDQHQNAQDDARRDIGLSDDDEAEIFDTRREPQDVEWEESGETVRSNERFGAPDEPYDAVDAEDVGTEWLVRATQSAPVEGRDPVDALEGTNVFEEPVVDLHAKSERKYGTDQSGEPLAPYAGTTEDDVAARLPVGSVDAQGNVGLRAPVTPPDALGAPPTSELSPTEEELARRAAALEAARRERR